MERRRKTQPVVETKGTIEKSNFNTQWKDLWIPLLSTVVALAGILSGTITQFYNNKTQLEAKQYEVTFNAKQAGYAEFMTAIQEYVDHCPLPEEMTKSDLLSKYLTIEPFISENASTEILNEIDVMDLECRQNKKVGTAHRFVISSLLREELFELK